MIPIKELAGYTSGIITIVALIVYLWAILNHRVESNKAAWGIWTIVTGMILLAYYDSVGFVDNIWVSIAYFFGVLLVFLMLNIYSKKETWTWVEKFSLVGVAIISIIWCVYKSSELALFLTLGIDLLGALPIILSTYRNPKGEFALAWYLGFIANTINLMAVEKWDLINALYPIYLASMTLIVAILASIRRNNLYDPAISRI